MIIPSERNPLNKFAMCASSVSYELRNALRSLDGVLDYLENSKPVCDDVAGRGVDINATLRYLHGLRRKIHLAKVGAELQLFGRAAGETKTAAEDPNGYPFDRATPESAHLKATSDELLDG